jgi:geranylgeranyl pyrophosphate synthase
MIKPLADITMPVVGLTIANSSAEEAQKAIQTLPESDWRDALEQLAGYSVNRNM